MPFMTTPERLGRIEELRECIEPHLELKFGAAALQLMPEIRQINDLEVLRAVFRAINTAASPDELRQIWAQRSATRRNYRPFMTTPERLGWIQGLLPSLEVALKIKFGAAGLELMSEIRQIYDVEMLCAILDGIQTAANPDSLRGIWAA